MVVAGHAGLAGDAGGIEDDLGALEALCEAGRSGLVTLDGGLSVDVGDVDGDTGPAVDVVEGEVGDVGVELHEKGEGLPAPRTATLESCRVDLSWVDLPQL